MARRLFRPSWAVFLGVCSVAGGLGCNALAGIELGSLETSEGGPGSGPDATTGDASGGDGASGAADGGPSDGGPSDGGSAEATGPAAPTFTCAGSSSPFVVANLENATDGGRQFSFDITLAVTQDQAARVVVQLAQNNTGEAFRVYDVRWQPTSLDSAWSVSPPNGGYVSSAATTPTGLTMVVSNQSYDFDSGTYSSNLLAYPIPASARDLGSSPPPFPLTPTMPNTNFNGSAYVLELGADDDFVFTRPVVGNGSSLQSSRSTRDGGPGTPTTFGTSDQQHSDPPALVHGGSSVYAMLGNDPTSDGGVEIYKLADNGVNGTVTPTMLASNTLIAGAYPSTVDATKIATFAATLVLAPTAQFSLFSGLVDATNFEQLQISALHPGPVLGLHEVPTGKSGSAFVNDQLVLAGLSPVATDQGINFIWLDTNGHVLGEAIGDSRLYNTRPGIQAVAIAPVSVVANLLATFFVSWIEERSDGTGSYDVLYVDQVQCSAN